MNKLYSVHDHWTDIDKKNDVDIESIDGVITGIKVNGEDYGGSSDFSTATLSIVDEGGYRVNLNFATLNERGFSLGGFPEWIDTGDLTVILYKGTAMLTLENPSNAVINVSGAIDDAGDNMYIITGDCTMTISNIS